MVLYYFDSITGRVPSGEHPKVLGKLPRRLRHFVARLSPREGHIVPALAQTIPIVNGLAFGLARARPLEIHERRFPAVVAERVLIHPSHYGAGDDCLWPDCHSMGVAGSAEI